MGVFGICACAVVRLIPSPPPLGAAYDDCMVYRVLAVVVRTMLALRSTSERHRIYGDSTGPWNMKQNGCSSLATSTTLGMLA